ncbi:MAG TPA: AAA family ATPase [bacterium]|nr:AAA family ATPase [bacterium]
MDFPRITSINIKGFKCFRDFSADFSEFEVFVGANGTGKTSLFDFLRFLRDGVKDKIPPGIITGFLGQEVFNKSNKSEGDFFSWSLQFVNGNGLGILYEGELKGPIGKIIINKEGIACPHWKRMDNINYDRLVNRNPDWAFEGDIRTYRGYNIGPNQLGLQFPSEKNKAINFLSDYIGSWGFYSSFEIDRSTMRRSIPIEQHAELREDAGNISAILFNLFTDHADIYDALQGYIKQVIPGFRGLKIRARGGPGEVIAFWTEEGIKSELTMADLSDGVLNFIIWATLCVHPNPPPLICIDEPEVGLHPRALPLLAGLLEQATERTQVFITTHSSYMLAQFPFQNITVMAKENGEVVAKKPASSKVLNAFLEDFGQSDIEAMHRSEELETFS